VILRKEVGEHDDRAAAEGTVGCWQSTRVKILEDANYDGERGDVDQQRGEEIFDHRQGATIHGVEGRPFAGRRQRETEAGYARYQRLAERCDWQAEKVTAMAPNADWWDRAKLPPRPQPNREAQLQAVIGNRSDASLCGVAVLL
jgi:hypothetical protein